MKLRLREVVSTGYLKTERIGLLADEQCSSKGYCLGTCHFVGDRFEFRQPSIFRLPEISLRSRDMIQIWIKDLARTITQGDEGQKIRHIGWGKRRPIWANSNAGIVLQRISGFDALRPETSTRPPLL